MAIPRINVPSDVAQAVIERWPDLGPEWCDQASDDLAKLCTTYGAMPTSVFRSRYALVVEVRTKRSQLVMRSSPDPDGLLQAGALISLAALGVAPALYDVVETQTAVWTVSERILPGTSLYDVRASVRDLARMLAPLKDQPAPLAGMPSIADWLRPRLIADELVDLARGRSVAPYDQRQSALGLLAELDADCPRSLCHGDPSRGNVLVSENNRLLLIDPRGVCGDLAYDVALAAVKTAEDDQAMPRLAELALLAGCDAERAHAWSVVADAARV